MAARPSKGWCSVPRIKGAKEHSRRLERMRGRGAERLIGQALFVGGNTIQVEAQISITAGAQSGKGHVPSQPGQAPNADTHRLADNIETVQPAPLRVEVSSNAPYSAALEFGTSKVAARPFMGPAVAAKKDEVIALVARAISEANK
ncbi:HK97-gp10 family putative phage morphogenesis protein [Sphingomonas sp. 1P08PE]|uniref:HK97-gp10 family putative phage morphogenesis protein n=1 Tax=Sphingomonas sp. 1P08PE TaxID=554122 RepID=UPI0039A39BB8